MKSFSSYISEKELSTKQKKIAQLAGDPTKIDAEDLKKIRGESTIDEVLDKGSSASEWIHDFVHSDNPKFEGKSKKERMKMALAAYYDKQRNEEFSSNLEESIIEELSKDENV